MSTNRQATALVKFITPSQETPDPHLVKQENEKLAKKFMVVGAMTGRGVLPLIKVPPKVKINSKQYVETVLTRLLEESVASLYPGELHEVFVHHEKASAHTAHNTQRYAPDLKKKLGLTIIAN